MALAVARREGVWRGDLARLHRDGREIPVSQVIVARTGDDGEVDFYATIARDMTRERAAEAALRASEERFRIAFEQAPIGFALLDLEGRYLQVNDAYCRTVRRTREELIGATPPASPTPRTSPTPNTRSSGSSRARSRSTASRSATSAATATRSGRSSRVGVFRDDDGSRSFSSA